MIQGKKKKKIKAQLQGNEYDEMKGFIDEKIQIKRANQEIIRSHHEWEKKQRFKHQTKGAQNMYKEVEAPVVM